MYFVFFLSIIPLNHQVGFKKKKKFLFFLTFLNFPARDSIALFIYSTTRCRRKKICFRHALCVFSINNTPEMQGWFQKSEEISVFLTFFKNHPFGQRFEKFICFSRKDIEGKKEKSIFLTVLKKFFLRQIIKLR